MSKFTNVFSNRPRRQVDGSRCDLKRTLAAAVETSWPVPAGLQPDHFDWKNQSVFISLLIVSLIDLPWPVSGAKGRRRVARRVLCLVDCEVVCGAAAAAALCVPAAISPVFPVQLSWPLCAAELSISSSPPVAMSLQFLKWKQFRIISIVTVRLRSTAINTSSNSNSCQLSLNRLINVHSCLITCYNPLLTYRLGCPKNWSNIRKKFGQHFPGLCSVMLEIFQRIRRSRSHRPNAAIERIKRSRRSASLPQ